MGMQLPDLMSGSIVSVDTETSGLHPDDGARVSVISIAWSDGERIRSAAFPFDQGLRDKLPVAQHSMFESDYNLDLDAWDELLFWLMDKRLVFHNAKYDLHMLRTGTRHYPGKNLLRAFHSDTMVTQRVLDPLEPVGLDAAAQRRLGKSKMLLTSELGAAKTKRYDLLDWDVIGPYASQDAELTLELYDDQQTRIEEGEVPRAWVDLETDLTRVLYQIEQRGLSFDWARSLEAAEVLELRAKEIEARLPFPPNPNGAKAYFYGQLGLPPSKTTPKGSPSLDDEAVRGLVEQGVQHAQDYADISDLRRAQSMWYRAYPEMIGADGRLRTSFRQTKVVSGRMSVERVQLQAIPKADKNLEGVPGVRELFFAREGHELWNFDLSQAELRVAAKFSGCTSMLAMLEGGADIHGETCQAVLGTKPDDPNWKRDRDIAKRLTFGSIFLIGARKFQATLSKLAGIHLDMVECERIVNNWRRTYPEFKRAYYRSEKFVEQYGYVRLYDGRPSFLGPREFTHTAWNRIVQGSLAEFLKYWLVEVERRWPGLLVLTVHDSLVCEIPADRDLEVVPEIKDFTGRLATKAFGVTMSADVGLWHK